MPDLDAVFKPKSIAIIGASRRRGTVGRELLYNLVRYGFNGAVYPVNPKAEYIQSIKCHASVLDIPDPVDLAMIVVPKQFVLEIAQECGKKGCKGLIVISAGFKEIGGKGIENEKKLLEIVKKYRMRLIGPNCMGVINTEKEYRMNATFAPSLPLRGNVGFISQSGALGVIILNLAETLNLGLSKFASMGNKADVSANDLLEDFENDKNTKLILMYLESFGNPRKFTNIARRLSREKPIIAVKAGRTIQGAKAASSHTGALSSLDVATNALFEQCGVIRVNSIEELFDYAVSFASQPLPKGNKVVIVTNAGGPGIMATDACVSMGLEMSILSENTKKNIRKKIPEEASVENPIDLLAEADAKMFDFVMNEVLKDDNVDAVITIFVPPIMIDSTEVAVSISEASQKYGKPVLGCFMGREEVLSSVRSLKSRSVPAYLFPESAAKSLSEMYKYQKWKNKKIGVVQKYDVDRNKVKEIFENVYSENRNWLKESEVKAVLETYGFTFPKSKLARNLDEALNIAKEIGYPVVLKVSSKEIIHKSDVNGIMLDIENHYELKDKYNEMVKNLGEKYNLDGILIQQMLKGGKETILGMSVDPNFGPLIMFGLGGIYVEILKDVTFRITPLTDVDSMEMIQSIRGYPLLEGVRGEKGVDIEAISISLQKLSQFVCENYDVEQLDINPLYVFEKGKKPIALDARIKLKNRK